MEKNLMTGNVCKTLLSFSLFCAYGISGFSFLHVCSEEIDNYEFIEQG